MAGLRLDLKEELFKPRKNGATIVPGKPDASLVYQRISGVVVFEPSVVAIDDRTGEVHA